MAQTPSDFLLDQIKTIAIAGAAPHIQAGLEKRIARLEATLEEVLEFLSGQEDVVDGSYGEPAPNRAMSLANTIREDLGRGIF